MANKKKQERDGWGVKKKMQIAPMGAKEEETKPKQKKSSWKRWEVDEDENDIETKETKEEGKYSKANAVPQNVVYNYR